MKFKYRVTYKGSYTFAENGVELDRIVKDLLQNRTGGNIVFTIEVVIGDRVAPVGVWY